MRYDSFVALSLNISRNKALELIEKKEVLLNQKSFKPSFNVKNYLQSLLGDENLEEKDLLNSKALKLELLTKIYVSRGALKLKNFILQSALDIKNKTCLDIGSSTGGFVEVLLEFKAAKVVALDVGSNQLHQSLRENQRVKVFENTDLKDFKSDEKFEVITCDVSFTSLLNLLFYIDKFALKDIILLFKPEFEAGKNAKRTKKGVLKDEERLLEVRKEFEKACLDLGWELKNTAVSSIKGKEGNVEYFYHYTKA
ncbi:MAG: TlyA family RNA methyltransferase [Campylobacter sp.]|nr:TlyA family RNA methyltransferase [Campylobacter sp.]